MSYQRYNFDSSGANAGILDDIDIQLLYITRSRYNEQWQSALHAHPFTELFFVVEGQGMLFAEDSSRPIRNSDLIIVNPGTMHTETNDRTNSLEYIALGIDGLSFQTAVGHNSHYNLYHFHNYRSETLFYLEKIIRELQHQEEGYREICTSLLNILILLILRNTNSKFTAASSDRTSRECKFIEQYLNEHFAENITLDTLSSLTYMNKYYMVHAFKKYKGLSPINYLIDRRISEAKRLLETTNHSVSKISQAVGFSSQSYFSQVFRKELGITPLQYRKQSEKA